MLFGMPKVEFVMRRLIVEVNGDGTAWFVGEPTLKNIEHMEAKSSKGSPE
jgi:hypothetical protein